MGRRANLFEEARRCVTVLKCKNPSQHMYECNLPLCLISITRRNLKKVCLKIIDNLEKEICDPELHARFYRLIALHKSQLIRYTKMYKGSVCQNNIVSNITHLNNLVFLVDNVSATINCDLF